MPPGKTPHRIAVLADQCVQCGLCLPVCPTYALDGNEAESPRGRIAIAAALAQGQVELSAALREPLDHCLGCLNCQRVCPAGVQYEELWVETRAMLGPSPTWPRRLLKLIKRPRLTGLLVRMATSIGLPSWGPALLPLSKNSPWRAGLGLLNMPRPSLRSLMPRAACVDETLPHLALFPGCVASVVDRDAEDAATALLRAAGYRVSTLPAFCCGALDLHGGASADADRAAARVRHAWEASGAERLISVTPGCLTALRQALPNVAVTDPFALLAERTEQLRFKPSALRVALHLPCTQVNVAKSEAALIQLLQRVPGLELQRMSPPPFCCGAAGTHLLEFPARATRLRADILSQLNALAPQALLSSNIGCRMHLAAGLAEQDDPLTTMHPLSLLARQLES
jgi:glycolate oxidase iron-sulfur subunit